MRALAHPTLRRLALRLRHFVPSRDGVAAVEFAMVLPVMVLMYLGMTELTFAVNTDRKITCCRAPSPTSPGARRASTPPTWTRSSTPQAR
jgi:hypothetical protein